MLFLRGPRSAVELVHHDERNGARQGTKEGLIIDRSPLPEVRRLAAHPVPHRRLPQAASGIPSFCALVQIPRLSRSMRLRVPMLAGPDGFPRWWVGLGGSP